MLFVQPSGQLNQSFSISASFSLVMSLNPLKQTLASFTVQILLVLFLKVRKAMTHSTKIHKYIPCICGFMFIRQCSVDNMHKIAQLKKLFQHRQECEEWFKWSQSNYTINVERLKRIC